MVKIQEHCPDNLNIEREGGMYDPKVSLFGSIRNCECGDELNYSD